MSTMWPKEDELDLNLLTWNYFYIARCKKQEINIQDEHIFIQWMQENNPIYACMIMWAEKGRVQCVCANAWI